MKKTKLSLLVFVVFSSFNIGSTQSLTAKAEHTPIDTSFLTTINGVEQYLEIKGASRTNPVLLFIHGGPQRP